MNQPIKTKKSQHIPKHHNKTLGTSVINSPMFPPSLGAINFYKGFYQFNLRQAKKQILQQIYISLFEILKLLYNLQCLSVSELKK